MITVIKFSIQNSQSAFSIPNFAIGNWGRIFTDLLPKPIHSCIWSGRCSRREHQRTERIPFGSNGIGFDEKGFGQQPFYPQLTYDI